MLYKFKILILQKINEIRGVLCPLYTTYGAIYTLLFHIGASYYTRRIQVRSLKITKEILFSQKNGSDF